MKLSTVINLSTFFLTAAAIGYAVIGITVSQRNEVEAIFDGLDEIRNGRESLTNDTLAFVQSQTRDQDTLSKNCEVLSNRISLFRDSIKSLPSGHEQLESLLTAALDVAKSTTNRVDRIRAQNAVLTNVESTLPRLVASLLDELPAKTGHLTQLTEFANTFPVVARSQHQQAEQFILAARSDLERIRLQKLDKDASNKIDLAIAQIEKVLAYRSFQQTELRLLIEARNNSEFNTALHLAKQAVDRFQNHSQGLIRILTVASFTLIAFGCAGVWQFRHQAKRLRQLNDELESRVQARTRDAAEARRRSEAQLSALDRIQGRVEFDTSGIITQINDNYLVTTGYTRDEVVGQHHQMFVYADDYEREEYTEFWKRLKSGSYSVGEYRRKAKDGSERWIHATYSPVVDETGQIEKVVKYATDITKQRSLEEKAQRRIRDLANVILESPNEVYICDADSLRFIEVNHGAIDASGYTAAELLNMTPLDLNPNFDQESIVTFLEDLRTGRKEYLDFQSNHQRKNGESYPVQISVHLSTYNEVPVFVAFVTDLTSVRRLEEDLALARKLESVGQMAAGIAHEINTPLQYISGNIEYLSNCSDRLFKVVDCYQSLLEDDAAPENWETRIQQMQDLLNSCRFASIREQMPAAIEESREGVCRTVKIVRAMRDFSHPGTKDMLPANLNNLIESTIAISRNRWKQVAEVELQLDADLPDIPMLASEMNQVLLNLIVNAGDAIGERYPVDCGELGTIHITTQFDDDWVRLVVADNGSGIPEEVRARVFDQFFTTKDVGKGTGQGLSLAHGVVVNEHHGHIELASEVGVGTSFTVKLPRSQSESEAPVVVGASCSNAS